MKKVKTESDGSVAKSSPAPKGSKANGGSSTSTTNNADSKGSDKPKAYTIKYKRPRGSRACTVCRARKVRCDAEIHIPCTNCITFGCECVLPETKKRGQAQDSKPSKKRTKEEDKEDVAHTHPVPHAHTHQHHPHHHHPEAAPPMTPSQSLTNANAVSLSAAEPIHNISQVSVPPSLTSNYKTRPSMHKKDMLNSKAKAALTFVGHSSIGAVTSRIGQNHVQLTEDLFEASDNSSADSVELEILKMRGAFLLPPKQLALDIIESYFEHIHPLMPVINRTEFMRKFNDPNDSPSLMLLQAVLLCGSRVSNNPLLFDSKGQSNLASLTFFRRAKSLYETNYESDPVSIIQTVILIGSYWEGPEDVTRNSFYWTRVGVGLAQGFGFHRDVSASPSLSEVDKKVWRRIWWCLFEKDRNVAIAFGRPPTINLTDCDVPMLAMEDFNEDEPENGLVSPYPVNELQALYFIHLVKLAEITGIIIKHQYTVKAESMKRVNKFSVIQHCDMLMGIWFTNLPPQLSFSLTEPTKQNFYACLLNAQYYNRLYLIHRANLLRMARSSSTNPNNYKYPSWGISFQAARMISIVSKILLDKGALKYCPVMFVYILFSALVMLIYHVDSTNPVIASTASDALFISRAVLKELAKYWSIASVLIKLFDKYANDKMKRAEVIERNNQIVDHQERQKSRYTDNSTITRSERLHHEKDPHGGPVSPANSATSGVSPRGSSYNYTTPPQTSQPVPKPPQPDIEQLVRQFKNKKESEEQNNGQEQASSHKSKSSHSNGEHTPSSVNSFPDISLVTEKVPPSQGFFENFEPTQLFPTANFSHPPSRSQTPVVKTKDDGGATDEEPTMDDPVQPEHIDTQVPPPHIPMQAAQPQNGGPFGAATSAGAPNDLFTNFMDSSFINMNLQATAEEENYLNDDLGSLLNFQPM
ncbi:hypothetical protein FT663_03068 [Candidozyma haemuli var. vulneris]|uniref:Zn(2)-C6 fungal-type domain-containing protein n=1 Tax=Candidozyma haemuli TaxID=45357 RepID=A0A2V1B079_9ASCO|nr:hypothetical protein CXQ85_003805 [[Candida] haemuloni]KAF3988951.1 hypothetical protein FT662_03101 [[Candida] haemuloni var. vulneris]KAF3990741.1 hypothetical protein FT663_03068 [[Candida] haemuloni var. vulneris]PVH23515.1 hypothetical protein CXQ85_003805 [[Candida] haemuloni]